MSACIILHHRDSLYASIVQLPTRSYIFSRLQQPVGRRRRGQRFFERAASKQGANRCCLVVCDAQCQAMLEPCLLSEWPPSVSLKGPCPAAPAVPAGRVHGQRPVAPVPPKNLLKVVPHAAVKRPGPAGATQFGAPGELVWSSHPASMPQAAPMLWLCIARRRIALCTKLASAPHSLDRPLLICFYRCLVHRTQPRVHDHKA